MPLLTLDTEMVLKKSNAKITHLRNLACIADTLESTTKREQRVDQLLACKRLGVTVSTRKAEMSHLNNFPSVATGQLACDRSFWPFVSRFEFSGMRESDSLGKNHRTIIIAAHLSELSSCPPEHDACIAGIQRAPDRQVPS